MFLYIIRHGVTAWNKAKRMQGQTDIPLAEEGIELAVRTGMGMKRIPFDLVISSPLRRAVETAECVIQGRKIPIITDERIQEISFGEWEGECILNSKVLPEGYMDLFFHDPLHVPKAPGGETFLQVRERTGEFLKDICARKEYQDKNILISTHGAAGRCLLSHFYEDGVENIWRNGVPANCAVSLVEIKDGVGRVLKLDELYADQ